MAIIFYATENFEGRKGNRRITSEQQFLLVTAANFIDYYTSKSSPAKRSLGFKVSYKA
jgi:hypothetical protein